MKHLQNSNALVRLKIVQTETDEELYFHLWRSQKVALRSGSPCNLHIQELVPMKYSVEWCCSNLIQNGPQCQHHEELLGYFTSQENTHQHQDLCDWQILKPGIVGQILFEGFLDGPQDFANGSQPTFRPSILKNPPSLESLEMWNMFDMFAEWKKMDLSVFPGQGWVEMLGMQPGSYHSFYGIEFLTDIMFCDQHIYSIHQLNNITHITCHS